MQIKDKIVVITGGSKGLGKAIAKSFVEKNAKVIITGLDEQILKEASQEIGAIGVVSDVSDKKQVVSLAKEVVKKFGRIDVWVNNAGIWLPHGPIEELDLEKLHEIIEVNLFGTIHGSQVALSQMREQNNGMIVNILTTSALAGRKHSSGYCASKYATDGFTKSLRLEAEDQDIKVLAVYPGGMRTKFFDEQIPDNYDEYMDPNEVALKIIDNISKENPEVEQIIRRK